MFSLSFNVFLVFFFFNSYLEWEQFCSRFLSLRVSCGQGKLTLGFPRVQHDASGSSLVGMEEDNSAAEDLMGWGRGGLKS